MAEVAPLMRGRSPNHPRPFCPCCAPGKFDRVDDKRAAEREISEQLEVDGDE